MAFASHKAATVGLANTATLNQLNDTVVGIWDLEHDSSDHAPEAEAFLFSNGNGESVIGEDKRQLVEPSDFADGGKYRSIVKLFCQFKDAQGREVWMHGTGWLIRNDLLVTAGHCAFDWAHRFGTCTKVKAYIGYDGKASIKSGDCQFRTVSRVATTSSWLSAQGNRQSDVSFMKLHKAFNGVKPFKFTDTPVSGSTSLGVVGYPADLKGLDNEAGAQMYEMFVPTRWDLRTSKWTMLEYKIDTYGGNSGSPVLRENDYTGIGVHVYGGDSNSASVIGIHGNQFRDYEAAFKLEPVDVHIEGGFTSSTPGIQYVKIPRSKAPNVNNGESSLENGAHNGKKFSNRPLNGRPNSNETLEGFCATPSHKHPAIRNPTVHNKPIFHSSGDNSNLLGHDLTEEGFLDILKTAVGVGAPIVSNVLQTGLPIAFGPLGGIIGAVAGTALSAVGKLAREGAESDLVESIPKQDNITMRSIYAEAALQSILKMNKTKLEEEGILDDMKTAAGQLIPIAKRVAPMVLKVVKNEVLQILVEHLGKEKTGAEGEIDSHKVESSSADHKHQHHYHHQSAFGLNTGPESFAQHIAEASKADEESLLDIVSAGLKVLVPVAGPAISGLISMVGSRSESDIVDEDTTSDTVLHSLTERAILAEAALQAAINARHDFLAEEGFFDSFGSIVKRIGGTVLKHAPGVIKVVAPIAKSLINNALSGEGKLTGKPPGGRSLKNKRSTTALRDLISSAHQPSTLTGRVWVE